jgi:hypothetical protein
MRKTLITVFILSIAATSNAQQTKATPPKPTMKEVKFAPPVIKDEKGNIEKTNTKAVKIPPPVLKKKPARPTKKTTSNQVKFAPPVIKKNAEEKN